MRLSGTNAPHVGRTATQLAVLMLCASGAHAQPPEPERPPEPSLTPLSLSAISQEEQRRQPLVFSTETGSPLGVTLECPLCSGRDGWAPSTTSNAPWSAGAGTSFTVAGAGIGVAVLGSRNYRLPRYMAQPLGTAVDVTPAGAMSYSDLSSSRTEWTVSARVQRTLKTLRGGQTIGIVGDAWLPLNDSLDPARIGTNSPPYPRTDVPLLPAKAIRVGVTFGF